MVLKVLLHFSHLVRRHHLLIRTDIVLSAAYVNKHRAAVELWLWSFQNLLSLRVLHIPHAQNVGADLMSYSGPHRDEWRLHPQTDLAEFRDSSGVRIQGGKPTVRCGSLSAHTIIPR